ncbi:MAG TPA: PaaI family thioesterase [Acidimicrobiia bacterium]|nr:PaaI family thioesterase [Acidimicrobiia bacterium]HIL05192.1 PaaI family thioesterase [Acidimicrobiia bacterium]
MGKFRRNVPNLINPGGFVITEAPDPSDPDYGEFPLRTFLGFDLDVKSPGEVVAVLDLEERHLNPNGVVGGGVLFTLIDTAMGKAVFSMLNEDQICASLEVSTRFLKGVGSGKIEADVSVIKAGRRIVTVEARAHAEPDHQLLAVATATFAVIDL